MTAAAMALASLLSLPGAKYDSVNVEFLRKFPEENQPITLCVKEKRLNLLPMTKRHWVADLRILGMTDDDWEAFGDSSLKILFHEKLAQAGPMVFLPNPGSRTLRVQVPLKEVWYLVVESNPFFGTERPNPWHVAPDSAKAEFRVDWNEKLDVELRLAPKGADSSQANLVLPLVLHRSEYLEKGVSNYDKQRIINETILHLRRLEERAEAEAQAKRDKPMLLSPAWWKSLNEERKSGKRYSPEKIENLIKVEKIELTGYKESRLGEE